MGNTLTANPFSIVALTAACSVVPSVSGCNRVDAERLAEGAISRNVAHAKQTGQTSLTLFHEDEGWFNWAVEASLTSILQEHSLLLAKSTGRSAVSFNADYIMTWHLFDVLQRRPANGTMEAGWCASEMPEVKIPIGPSQVAVPLLQGSVHVQGITITMAGPRSEVSIAPGSRYLLIGSQCADRTMLLTVGSNGLLRVADDGRIYAPGGKPARYVQDLIDLRTVDRVFESH